MKLTIIRDELAESPRDWDNLGTIAYKHDRYILGEEKISDPIDWLAGMLDWDEDKVQRLADRLDSNYYSNEVLDWLECEFFSKYIALPLYLYDHSGITIATRPFACRWDSGKVGYIYVTKEDAKKWYGWKRLTEQREKRVESFLQSEVEVFDQYLNGDVYGYELEDDEGNLIDSCWGFYGDNFHTNGMKDHIPKEAHHLIDEAADNIQSGWR